MKSVLLATSADWPDLFQDDRPLRDALLARGLDARAAVWDDPGVDWAAADLIVLRSIWDYTRHRDRFVAWTHEAAGATPMHNPAEIVEWNSHKLYLRDLEREGVRIVPTVWARGGASIDVAGIARERGWVEMVVKPCVSAGARDAVRGTVEDVQTQADELLAAGRDLMMQPYLPEVEGDGEHSLVLLGGELSHVMRKEPALAARVAWTSSTVRQVEPHPDELRLAEQLVEIVGPLLYARVDCVVLDERAHLMELELIEPQLFLRDGPPEATERLADLIGKLASRSDGITV